MRNSTLKCLFIHDHKFRTSESRIYSEGKFGDAVLARYGHTTDKITVLSRLMASDNPENLCEITLDNVHFAPVQGLSFARIFTKDLVGNMRHILQLMDNADFLVVRMPSFLGTFSLLVNLLNRKPVFIELVGDTEVVLLALTQRKALKKPISWLTALNSWLINNADGVIYVTQEALQKKYPTQGLVSYASNVEVVVKDRVLESNNYQVRNSVFKVGLIGSFNNAYKGIHEAISAVKLLKEQGYIIHLHLLGSGALQSYYEAMAETLAVQDCIHFDGVLAGGSAVLSWLGELDLYIQPSYSEGLPRALIEAMSVGLPTVATKVGGIAELIAPEHLIPPRDAQALAEQIASFMQSLALRYQAGQRNYQTAKNYDQQVLAQRRTEFWQQARQLVLKRTHKRFLLFASYLPSVLKFRGKLLETIAASGYDIHILAPDVAAFPDDQHQLSELGYCVQQIPMQRTGTNPLADIRTLCATYSVLRKIKPDYLLTYTIKPVIYGTLAGWLAKVPQRFALITGAGYTFIPVENLQQRKLSQRFVQRLAHGLYKQALARTHQVFFQNPDDRDLFQQLHLTQPDTVTNVVNGSGVDVSEFTEMPFPRDNDGHIKPAFLLIARLLKDKGIVEYVEAAKQIKPHFPDAEFHLVGWHDDNPTAISPQQLEAWVADDIVTYWGKLSDVRTAIAACSTYVLPSYREGTPRSVLEAMAMGRPVITTDTAGCRETVIEGDNGYLVPVGAVDELAAAMRKFLKQPQLYQRMGRASRRLALAKYDVHKVNAQMIAAMALEGIAHG